MKYRHYLITGVDGDDVLAISEAQGFEAALADHYRHGLGVDVRGMTFEQLHEEPDNKFDRAFTHRVFEVHEDHEREIYSELSISFDAGESFNRADLEGDWCNGQRLMRVH